MQPDIVLIALVERRTTGASIHAVRNALSCYRSYVELSEDDPAAQEKAKEYEQRLRAFAVSGKVEHLRI